MLVSLDTVKQYLNILVTEYDTPLTDFIDISSKNIENYCNQPIESTLVTETFKGNSLYKRTLRGVPVSAINQIQYKTNVNEDWNIVSSANYELLNYGGAYTVETLDGFANNYTYQIGYNTGFSSVPDDIRHVCTEMVAKIWKESDLQGSGLLGVDSISENRMNIVETKKYINMNIRWQNILDKYKVYTI